LINSSDIRDPWVVKSTDVEINEEKPLGKGAFSEVFLGVLNGLFYISLKYSPFKMQEMCHYFNLIKVSKFNFIRQKLQISAKYAKLFVFINSNMEINSR